MDKKKGMANILKILAVVITIVFSSPVFAQNDFCNVKNSSFQGGEKLTFHVFYNMSFVWIHAGTALFSTELDDVHGHNVFHITGDGTTQKSYEWFYKVSDRYETYIDKETLLPVHFVRNVSEGNIKFNQDVWFNHKKLSASSNGKNYCIPNCTQDVLSAIYYARNIDYDKYKPGDKIPFNMFLDDKVYNLYIKYVGKEKIKTKMGTFRAIKIVPLLIEGTIFEGGEKMTVWVSDDENHLPLRVDSPILVGSIKVDLIAYDGLRNPFTSMLKMK
jgi:hypothetical protein